MKKLLFVAIMILAGMNCYGQTAPVIVSQPTWFIKWIHVQDSIRSRRIFADSVFHLPSDTTVNKTGVADIGNIIFLGNGSFWASIASSDTTSLSSRLNLKIDSVKRFGDSAFYYANGVKHFAFLDTLSLQSVTNTGNFTSSAINFLQNDIILKQNGSTLLYSDSSVASLGLGYNFESGIISDYVTAIGWETGYGGTYDTYLGALAGFGDRLGYGNTFLGSYAGYESSGCTFCVYTGDLSGGGGHDSGYANTFTGYGSGENITSGFADDFYGRLAGFSITTGRDDKFIGENSGYSTTTGSADDFLGSETGYYNIDGYHNVYIGNGDGFTPAHAYANTLLGYSTGYQIGQHANHNVIIGIQSGAQVQDSMNIIIGDSAAHNLFKGTNDIILGSISDARATTDTVNNSTIIGDSIKTAVSNLVILGRHNQNVLLSNSDSVTAQTGDKLHVQGNINVLDSVKLPHYLGGAGQVLTTDGSGNLELVSGGDTTGLAAALAGKVNYGDSLSRYVTPHQLAGFNYLTSVDTGNIASFYTKVHSLFYAGSGLSYSGGLFSLLASDTAYLSAQMLLREKYSDSLGTYPLAPTASWVLAHAGSSLTFNAPLSLSGSTVSLDTGRHEGAAATNHFLDSLIALYLPASDTTALVETRNHAMLTFQLLGNYRPYSAIPPWDSTLLANDTAKRSIVVGGNVIPNGTDTIGNKTTSWEGQFTTINASGNIYGQGIVEAGGGVGTMYGGYFRTTNSGGTPSELGGYGTASKSYIMGSSSYGPGIIDSLNYIFFPLLAYAAPTAAMDILLRDSTNLGKTSEEPIANLPFVSSTTSQTANYGFMAPNGSSGVPSFRALVNADLPLTLQQVTGNGIDSTNNISAFTMGLKVGFYGTSFGGITTGGLQVIAPSGTVWAGLFQGNNAANLPVMLLGSEVGPTGNVGLYQTYTYNAGSTVPLALNPFGSDVLAGTNSDVAGNTLISGGNALIEGSLKVKAPLPGVLTDSIFNWHPGDSTARLVLPDSSLIPNFYKKVQAEISVASGLTYNNGQVGIDSTKAPQFVYTTSGISGAATGTTALFTTQSGRGHFIITSIAIFQTVTATAPTINIGYTGANYSDYLSGYVLYGTAYEQTVETGSNLSAIVAIGASTTMNVKVTSAGGGTSVFTIIVTGNYEN